MTKIIEISGVDMPAPGERKLFTVLGHDIGDISEGQLDLLIARDNMVAKRDIVAKEKGIGAVKTQKFQNTIDVLDDALHAINLPNALHHMHAIEEDILAGEYSLAERVAGIGSLEGIGKFRKEAANNRRLRRAKRVHAEGISGIGKAKAAQKAATKTGNFIKKAATKTEPALKKVVTPVKAAAHSKAAQKTVAVVKKAANTKAGKVVTKVAKTAIKVATAPTRLIVKGILEITLPKAAPFFLYLFINDPALIAKMPPKAKRKRDTSLKVKNFIVNVIGMKDAHFMGIVRNGIMKQLGASPETILQRSMGTISGIGVVTEMVASLVVQIITKLIEAFKKDKSAAPSEQEVKDGVPDPKSDFAEFTEGAMKLFAADVKKQNDLPEPTEEVRPKAETTASAPARSEQQLNQEAPSATKETPTPSNNAGGGGGSETETPSKAPVKQAQAAPKDTDENGEILKEAGDKDFATGGRKGWNTLG